MKRSPTFRPSSRLSSYAYKIEWYPFVECHALAAPDLQALRCFQTSEVNLTCHGIDHFSRL